MASQEHLDILRQGTDIWLEWRKEHPDIQPDLSGGDLRGLDLQHAFLTNANLEHADLSGANLTHASLLGAILNEAILVRTSLQQTLLVGTQFRRATATQANVMGANLNRADLQDANFTEASLRLANLSQSNLTRATLAQVELIDADISFANVDTADFSQAQVGYTRFGGLDLSTVKGLDTVIHRGPSAIGTDTIILSQGKISQIFLRKAGVPQSIIEQIPALIGSLKPIDFSSCFISYSSKDHNFADSLYADLQNKGVRCWFAPEDLKIGDKFWHRIDESIRLYDKLLVVLSEHSIQSDWVEREVMAALEKEKQGKIVLFPITLDDAVKDCTAPWAADIRRSRHIGDFRGWKNHDDYQKAFERLLRDLKATS